MSRHFVVVVYYVIRAVLAPVWAAV